MTTATFWKQESRWTSDNGLSRLEKAASQASGTAGRSSLIYASLQRAWELTALDTSGTGEKGKAARRTESGFQTGSSYRFLLQLYTKRQLPLALAEASTVILSGQGKRRGPFN